MKRAVALVGIISALTLSAQANIVDFDNDPGSEYTRYFPGGANQRVLDDVGRSLPGGALIKQINIVFFNLNQFAVNATLYVYDATGANGGVGNLLYTATIQNIPNGLFQLQFGTPNIGGGQQNLWIGLAASADAQAWCCRRTRTRPSEPARMCSPGIRTVTARLIRMSTSSSAATR
jgi:hypothetical protein